MVNGINFAPVRQGVTSLARTMSPWVGIALAVAVVTVTVIKLVRHFRHQHVAPIPPHRILPINEARSFIAQANVAAPDAAYTQDAQLYKNVAQLISGHLGLANVGSLARVNRIWHNAAQPVLRNLTCLNDDLSYGLETAFRERGERQITQKVYYDRPKDAFYIFNNFLGENPELFEIGRVSVEAQENPVRIQLGQNSTYILRPQNVIFTAADNITPELRAKGREFQALCTLI